MTTAVVRSADLTAFGTAAGQQRVLPYRKADTRAVRTVTQDPLVPTIFHEHWWLDLASGGRYEEAQVREHGRLIGRLPYVITRRRRVFRVSVMPDLTHLLGPAVDAGSGSGNTRWLRHLDITQELATRLPRLSLIAQVCHPQTPELFGFQSAGFEALMQFSAEIDPAPEEALWLGMRDKTRNVIRRARERQKLAFLDDPEAFTRFYRDNLGERGRASYFDLDLIAPLYEAASQRGQACILASRNTDGRLVAAVLYVWDQHRLWYFLSSRNPALPDNGAVSLLIWHGLQEASRRGLIFDFDGVASSGSARFYAGFGARVVPRYAIRRTSGLYALATAARDCLRGTRRNFFTAS